MSLMELAKVKNGEKVSFALSGEPGQTAEIRYAFDAAGVEVWNTKTIQFDKEGKYMLEESFSNPSKDPIQVYILRDGAEPIGLEIQSGPLVQQQKQSKERPSFVESFSLGKFEIPHTYKGREVGPLFYPLLIATGGIGALALYKAMQKHKTGEKQESGE